MPTRAIILKLAIPRSGAPDAALTRQALWRTHQEINTATAHYERNLLLLRGRQYQTANSVINVADARAATIAHARGVQRENLNEPNASASSLGTDDEIITILNALYVAIVPSVIGMDGTAQKAKGHLKPLTDRASKGNQLAILKLARLPPNWLALIDSDPPAALEAANAWFVSPASSEWRSDTGSPATWLRKARLGDATWLKLFSEKLAALKDETRDGLPDLYTRLRALHLLPLFPAYFAGRIADTGAAAWDSLAFGLAVAHLLSWESWSRRAANEHARRNATLTKFRADHLIGDVAAKIEVLRGFERQRSAHLSTLGLGASEYQLMRRQLRNWPDLRERWLKSSSTDPASLLAIANTEQTRLRGRFGDAAVFAWLAATPNQHIWRSDPDAVSLLVSLNGMEALVARSRETALMTFANAVAHPRAVQWSAVGDNNLRPYRISMNKAGECLAQLRLFVPRNGDGLLVDQQITLKLAPSKQFRAPSFDMRAKKAVVTFKTARTNIMTGVLGSADLLFDRRHLETQHLGALVAGDIGPAWLKLSLDLDPIPSDGWTKDAAKFAYHFRSAAGKTTGHEARVVPGNRVLSIDLGVGTFAACSVFLLTDSKPKNERFALSIEAGDRSLWAVHERSFHLTLQDEVADRAGLAWRREQDERLRRLGKAFSRHRQMLQLGQLTGDKRAQAFTSFRTALTAGDPFPFEISLLAGLEEKFAAPDPIWTAGVETMLGTFRIEMGSVIKEWREGRVRTTEHRSGPSMWAIQHLSDIRRLLLRWSLMGRSSRDLRRQDRAARCVFASHLLTHINALKENRLKSGADMIVQAARGYQRDKAGRWRHVHPACDLVLFEDLSRYRMLTDRPRRENSQLMLWAHRAMPAEVAMQGDLYGLVVINTGAAFSSRYHARSMTPGIRCRALTKSDLTDVYLRERLAEDGAAIEMMKAGDLVPWDGGEIFVCPREGDGLWRIDANINAAQNLQRRFWTRHGDGFRIPCRVGEIAGQQIFVPRSFGPRLLGAMGGYGVLEPLSADSPACRWRTMKHSELRKLGLFGGGDAGGEAGDSTGAEELQGLAEEALQISGQVQVFFRDPSGIVLPSDRWYPPKVFWGQVRMRVTKALAETPSAGNLATSVYRAGIR